MNEINYELVTGDKELKGAFEVRRQAFVEEQGISVGLVFDDRDRKALHVVVTDDEGVVGTARVLFLVDNQAKLERMAILKARRNQGIGRGIISFLGEELKTRQVKQVVLHAQYGVVAFYKACGFEESGSPFWEAGIKHRKMMKRL